MVKKLEDVIKNLPPNRIQKIKDRTKKLSLEIKKEELYTSRVVTDKQNKK